MTPKVKQGTNRAVYRLLNLMPQAKAFIREYLGSRNFPEVPGASAVLKEKSFAVTVLEIHNLISEGRKETWAYTLQIKQKTLDYEAR